MNQKEAESVKDLTKSCNDVLEKLGWRWEPTIGDKVCRDEMILFYAKNIRAIHGKRAGRFISDAGTEYEWPVDFVTPIVSWEKIKTILEEAEYRMSNLIRDVVTDHWIVNFQKLKWQGPVLTKNLCIGTGQLLQEAVMKATINLGENLKEKAK